MDYDVVFKTGQELFEPGQLVDVPPATPWTFTTGSEQVPTLSLEGELSVTFEAGEDPAIGDCTSCGCLPSGEMLQVTKARVRLPRAVGGFEPRRGQLFLTDDVPESFSTPSKGDPEPPAHNVSLGGFAVLTGDAGQEILITVPDESTPYVPCFAFQAFDARDDRATAEPLCLHTQAQGSIPNEGTSQPDSVGPNTSSSCSIDGGSSPRSAWLPAALLLGLLSRRRRSRNAP
jgi:MYXO-CTERM domain-containing protein